eukprot:38264-Pelagomonas_calceolata.AAC.2
MKSPFALQLVTQTVRNWIRRIVYCNCDDTLKEGGCAEGFGQESKRLGPGLLDFNAGGCLVPFMCQASRNSH